jgi:hypothetical protein
MTQLAAAYARARIDDRWRLVAWVNAEHTASVLGGLAAAAAALGLDDGTGDAEAAGRAVRRQLGRRGSLPGPGPPRHPAIPEQPRGRLRGRGPGHRGDPAARAQPRRPRAGAGPGSPRQPDLPEQPRRLPGGGPGGQAIALFERTLADCERVLGPDHPAPWPPGTTSPPPGRHWTNACPHREPGGTRRNVAAT